MPQNNKPTPPKRTVSDCLARAGKKYGLGAALDIASLIPGGGVGVDVARLIGSVASAQSASTTTGYAVGGAGVATTFAANVYRANPTLGYNVAKDTFEAIPVISTIVGIGAVAYDGYSAVTDYQACMAGK